MELEEQLDEVITKIRQIRMEHGISQQELANAANFSQSFLANLESGKKKPSVMTILRIAKALNINPRDFFPDVTYKSSDQIKKEILNLLNRLN
ncbi:MAG: helix-turn-helix transcriptional regulator [Treponema sp.]|nr:helix-turn-helix transcriptional regulator [Candidatus Treponema equi]